MKLTVILVSVVVLAVTLCHGQVNPGVDLTTTPGSRGAEVVEATLRRINRQGIFGDDSGFLRRLAFIESKDGSNLVSQGGIWWVNEFYLKASKSPSLSSYHQAIQSTLNISWQDVNTEDMAKPLYSALGARLYLETLPASIPRTLDGQSGYWFEYYNQRDAAINSFVEEIVKQENVTVPCTPKIDLVVLMDASGSIGPEDFALASQFTANLFTRVSLAASRLAYITFETTVEIVFDLNNELSISQIQNAVLSYEYFGGGTNTNAAIKAAVDTFLGATPLPGVPRVMTVFTDGKAGTPPTNIGLAKDANVSSFAIGIGPLIDEDELLVLAYDNPENVFIVRDYQELADYLGKILGETCGVSVTPSFNQTIPDELAADELRHYSFPITSAGISIRIAASEKFWITWSFEDPTPNFAYNDGYTTDPSFFIANPDGANRVYLTIKVDTNAANTVYTLTAYQGNV